MQHPTRVRSIRWPRGTRHLPQLHVQREEGSPSRLLVATGRRVGQVEPSGARVRPLRARYGVRHLGGARPHRHRSLRCRQSVGLDGPRGDGARGCQHRARAKLPPCEPATVGLRRGPRPSLSPAGTSPDDGAILRVAYSPTSGRLAHSTTSTTAGPSPSPARSMRSRRSMVRFEKPSRTIASV